MSPAPPCPAIARTTARPPRRPRADAGFRSRFHGRLVFVTFKVTFDGGDPIAFGDQNTSSLLDLEPLAANAPQATSEQITDPSAW